MIYSSYITLCGIIVQQLSLNSLFKSLNSIIMTFKKKEKLIKGSATL